MNVRHFRVVQLDGEKIEIGGVSISSKATPGSAARKLLTSIAHYKGLNKNKKASLPKVKFCIQEFTQGSSKKVYGPYVGHYHKYTAAELKKAATAKGKVNFTMKPVVKLVKGKNMKEADTKLHVVIASCGDEKNVKRIKELCTSKEKCKFFVYNKCGTMRNSIKLKNVGREFHTFCYHIVQHYDNLPEKIIFTASTLEKHKREQRLLYLLNYEGDHFCDCKVNASHGEKVIQDIPDNWSNTWYSGRNLYPANPHGFKQWYLTHVGNIDSSKKRCGNGIFKTSGIRIRKRPIEFYKNLIKELEVDNAPEAVHYLERLVSVIFM